jgi:HlyD family secretion protein
VGSNSSSTSTTGNVNTGTATAGFITLTDIAAPQVNALVSEADIGKVSPGEKINFTVSAFPGRTFTGTVARIDPIGQTVSNVVNYTVTSTVDPTDVTLLPSMTATISIIVDERNDVTLVPNSAISFASSQAGRAAASTGGQGAPARAASGNQGGQQGRPAGQASQGRSAQGAAASNDENASGTASAMVMVLRDGQPTPQRVQIGLSDDRQTQVVAGLQPGDQVIVGQGGAPAAAPSSGSSKPGGGNSIIPMGGGFRR